MTYALSAVLRLLGFLVVLVVLELEPGLAVVVDVFPGFMGGFSVSCE